MSVSAVGEDDFDSSMGSCSLLRTSFVAWASLHLSSSFLDPPAYQIRVIEDRGSLADSLESAKIDLFDRTPVSESRLISIARGIGRVVASILIFPVFSILGFCYHGCACLGSLILFNGKRVLHHFDQMETDFGAALVIIGTLGLILVSTGIFGFPNDFALPNFDEKDRYGFYKSTMLRDQFGIVSQRGGLLSWDPIKDADVDFDRLYPNDYKLKGYFSALYKSLATQFLETVQELQKALPNHCKMQPIYPPTAGKIILFLIKNRDSLDVSEAEFKDWKERLHRLEENMESIWRIISSGFVVQQSEYWGDSRWYYTLLKTFPISEEDCQSYFKK